MFLSSLALCAVTAFVAVHDRPIPEDKEIITTASGLMYSILEPGQKDGESPVLTDMVKVHYTGWYRDDGKEFDSSYHRGGPSEFKLGQVIQGWNEGLALMKIGSRFKLTIPYNLAYGEEGSRGIKPKADLIFEVELVDFKRGPGVPTYTALDPEKTKTLESGLKLQVITEGQGDAPAKDRLRIISYAFWDQEGNLMECDALARGPIKAASTDVSLAFLQTAFETMKPGECCLFEVPPSLGIPQIEKSTVWRLNALALPVKKAVPEEEWKTTDTGLQYRVEKEGTGDMAKMGQRVQVHYSGWLADGTLFDTSSGADPIVFVAGRGQVIAGWDEGIQLMKEGDVYTLRIPANLAYGSRGFPPRVPADAVLQFQVELVSIVK